MASQGLKIGPDGYFSRGGARFVPVGANYWPGSCGVEMWQRWPADEIRRDLDLLIRHGFNAIRFFLRWQDFEPSPGLYDDGSFLRFAELLKWCGERDLFSQPTFFTPFSGSALNGPEWRQGRNYFTDDFIIQRAVDFAFAAARVAAPYGAKLLAIDIGHQLCRLPDSQTAAPLSIKTWLHNVTAAVRGAFPGVLLVVGNGPEQLSQDTGWRLGEPAGTDFYAMHGSTLPSAHPVEFDGLTDPLGHSLIPLNIEMTRSFGPVMLQDLAVHPAFGHKQRDDWLRAVLPSCWNAGANGFLWHLLRDVPAECAGHTSYGSISPAGLLDAEENIKRGLEYFQEFAHAVPDLPRPRVSSHYIGLYIPRHYYPRDNPSAAGNDPGSVLRALSTANYHLRDAGHEVHIVRGDRPINPRTKTIFITGASLTLDEVMPLTAWVQAGGKLIWHGPDVLNWGEAYQKLLGALPIDFRLARDAVIAFGGGEWKIGHYPMNIRAELQLMGATVLAIDDGGLPAVLRNKLGKGTVTYAIANIEGAIAGGGMPRVDRDRCTKWYQAMLKD